ncbi:MAG: hypothetical protein FWE61_06360 [Micrococcales bacterium]|nr:hypothetical protein [Micrococcales bacterium]
MSAPGALPAAVDANRGPRWRETRGAFKLAAIDTAAWQRFAADCGVDDTWVLDRVRTLAAAAPAAVEQALAGTDAEGTDDLRTRLLPRLAAHTTTLTTQ